MSYSQGPVIGSGPVTCWWRQVVQTEVAQLVVPDGHADVLAYQDGSIVLVGPTASSETVLLPAATHVHAARIGVGRLHSLTGLSAEELRGRTLPVADLLGTRRSRLWGDTVLTRSRLPAAIAEHEGRRDRRLEVALRAMATDPGLGPEEVSHRTGLSSRHLRRLFHLHLGLSPRAWARVARLQRALHLLAQGPAMPLADVAATAGYSDHAHLTREVADLTGMPPSRLRQWQTGSAPAPS